MGPPKTVPHKFDPSEQFRSEIEERTANGETCKQIASALNARGIDITDKTISRRRVEWGLRQRPFYTRNIKRLAKPRPRDPHSKVAGVRDRKAEIELRTQRGETAGEIAEALIAAGYVLKKGESTVLRLQTTWGLIEPSVERARGRKRKAAGEKDEGKKASKREREREANREQRTTTMHYPSNCSFGPQKRGNGTTSTIIDNEFVGADDDNDGFPTPAPPQPLSPVLGRPRSPSMVVSAAHPTVNVAAEIMSVEFLVDLANSTLGAAMHLKDMLLAYQDRRPAPGATSDVPPSLEELSTARRKVREAAAVMHDLAVDPVADVSN